MSTPLLCCLDAAVAAIDADAERLTELDQAIGDGDHGINMRRGFAALAEQRDELAALDLAAALQKAGMTLVMKVGGASGPLYGSLLMAFGKRLQTQPQVGPAELAAGLRAGAEAVARRGKSTAGEKTMLDVLLPVADAFDAALGEGLRGSALTERLIAVAEASLAATAPLRATKGRASFLGERSVGHLDPGAGSSALLIATVCRTLNAPAAPTEGG